MTGGMYSSNTPEWETPQWLFDELNSEFGFTCDVCATAANAKLPAYYDSQVDGLAQEWQGVCWMNPPYGSVIGKWVKKAYESFLAGVIVVCLLPARTDTRWFHDWIYGKAEIRFIKGRLKFGNQANSAPFPSMIVIYGKSRREELTEGEK